MSCSWLRWFLSCHMKQQENSQLSSQHLMPPSVSMPCSFFWCCRRPEREENCFGHLEQEYPSSAILQDWFPANSYLILAAALHLSLASLTYGHVPVQYTLVTFPCDNNIHTLWSIQLFTLLYNSIHCEFNNIHGRSCSCL